MVDFPECDIPPPNRDVRTHRLLTDLLQQRNSLDQEFQVAIASIAADGTTLNPSTKYKNEFALRDEQYNRVNRRMYKVYAASAYLIHDRNFSSYCRPALRHLPQATAFKLATFKEKLQSQEHINPPYTTVQKPTSSKTQPVFTAPRPSYSDVVISRPLQPRPQWMRSQEPVVSDAEADRIWKQGNESMFGQTELTTPQLEKRINDLQYELYLRTESAARAHPDWAPPSKPLVSRTFRQGRKTDTADKMPKPPSNQSASEKRSFLLPKADAHDKMSVSTKHKKSINQSVSISHLTKNPDPALTVSLSGIKEAKEPGYSASALTHSSRPDATFSSTDNHSPRTQQTKKRKQVNDFGSGTFWNRQPNSRRQPSPNPSALAANANVSSSHDLIVDTGASHVLFQERHMDLLTNVQLSRPNQKPYAILRAANGQILTAIGRGVFTIKTIAVVAYVFRNEDLVHNLLGIAPFADCGCEAVFTAHDFNLYYKKVLLMTGKRHSANLWHISLPRDHEHDHATTLTPNDRPPKSALLLHEDTRQDAKYVQFIHACMGSPPPTTFLLAVQRGYLSGENQFPRLNATMVRKHMPNSEATARGHLNKTPTALQFPTLPHNQSVRGEDNMLTRHAHLGRTKTTQRNHLCDSTLPKSPNLQHYIWTTPAAYPRDTLMAPCTSL
jgi:hypothetical protein